MSVCLCLYVCLSVCLSHMYMYILSHVFVHVTLVYIHFSSICPFIYRKNVVVVKKRKRSGRRRPVRVRKPNHKVEQEVELIYLEKKETKMIG